MDAKEAKAHFGSLYRLARLLGLREQNAQWWGLRGTIPPKHDKRIRDLMAKDKRREAR